MNTYLHNHLILMVTIGMQKALKKLLIGWIKMGYDIKAKKCEAK